MSPQTYVYLIFLLVVVLIFDPVQIAGAMHYNATTPLAKATNRGLISTLASDLLSRGFLSPAVVGQGSQVVSLNLTNLLVLVLLKALIFAAGSLGASHWQSATGNSFARSNSPDPHNFLTEEEILLYLSYLSGNYKCLQKVACDHPQVAEKYKGAGDLLLKLSQMFINDPDQDGTYQYILKSMDLASKIGRYNQDCTKFICTGNEFK